MIILQQGKKNVDSMTKSDVKKYASTKHDKLPKKIEEKLDSEDKPFVKKLVVKQINKCSSSGSERTGR